MGVPLRDRLRDVYLRLRGYMLSPFICRRIGPREVRGVERILFIRYDRIGDMVLSTPAFRAVKAIFPHAEVIVLASERNHEVILHNPHVDRIIIYKGPLRSIGEIRRLGIDLVIDLINTYELGPALIAYLSGARYRMGFEVAGREVFFNLRGARLEPVKQLAEHILDLVKSLDGGVGEYRPEIFLTDEEEERAERLLQEMGLDLRPRIVVHPGGYYQSQRWPADRFARLVERIRQDLRAGVLMIGGVGEEVIIGRIKGICREDIPSLTGVSLRETMAAISRCDLFVGNNSGPLHIASTLGLPTVSIVGPTITPLWLPYGSNHIVLRKELDCSPCTRGVCRDHTCMESIPVEEVFKALVLQMERFGYC